MSWFSEIAGKAEDLLNKVDQTAATALQNKSKSSSNISGSSYSTVNADSFFEPDFSTSSAYSNSIRTSISPLKFQSNSEKKSSYNPGPLTPRKTPESDDEKLLKFLNCNDSLPTPSRKTKLKEVSENKMEVQNSDLQPIISSMGENDTKGENKVYLSQSEPLPLHTVSSEIFEGQKSASGEESFESSLQSTLASVEDTNTDEVTAPLNHPVSEDLLLAHKRAEHAEAEMRRMMMKLDYWNSQISGNDKLVRELREREKDMVSAMDAKDSQLAILKVRLQEADQELLSKQNIIEDLKAENERIIKEHANGAAFQNKTVESLQEQLQEAETELNKTRESFIKSQTEHMQQLGKMEEEHRHLVESYTSLQKKWTEINEIRLSN